MIEFGQQYAKEIFAFFVPLFTWILNNHFKAKAKLNVASPHGFMFLVQEPIKGADGAIISPSQTVRTMVTVHRQGFDN